MGRRIYRAILALCAVVLSLRLYPAGGCRAGERPGAVAVRQSGAGAGCPACGAPAYSMAMPGERC
jgi:hypothetical protein